MTDFEHIAEFVFRSLTETLNEGERMELEHWLGASPANQSWYASIQEEEHLRQLFLSYRGDLVAASKARVFDRIEAEMTAENSRPLYGLHFLRTAWFRYAAAIMLVFGIGAYLWTNNKDHQSKTNNTTKLQIDIPPGHDGAILILADGKQVLLDSAANGVVANQSGTEITLNNNRLVYDSKGASDVSFNTIHTPRGRQYKVVLPDGSAVWLNAESSITYPTAFIGKERKVSITGEVYMEIAKNSKQPFSVTTGKSAIQVLGTSFNLNVYADEEAQRTTLVEGAVKVEVGGLQQMLKPGQQAIVKEKITIVEADIEKTIAWKNGLFSFKNADLPAVMRQLARWYDLEVKYEGKIPPMELNGDIGRDLTLSEVLSGLAKTKVRYRMEGSRTIVILP